MSWKIIKIEIPGPIETKCKTLTSFQEARPDFQVKTSALQTPKTIFQLPEKCLRRYREKKKKSATPTKSRTVSLFYAQGGMGDNSQDELTATRQAQAATTCVRPAWKTPLPGQKSQARALQKSRQLHTRNLCSRLAAFLWQKKKKISDSKPLPKQPTNPSHL